MIAIIEVIISNRNETKERTIRWNVLTKLLQNERFHDAPEDDKDDDDVDNMKDAHYGRAVLSKLLLLLRY